MQLPLRPASATSSLWAVGPGPGRGRGRLLAGQPSLLLTPQARSGVCSPEWPHTQGGMTNVLSQADTVRVSATGHASPRPGQTWAAWCGGSVPGQHGLRPSGPPARPCGVAPSWVRLGVRGAWARGAPAENPSADKPGRCGLGRAPGSIQSIAYIFGIFILK